MKKQQRAKTISNLNQEDVAQRGDARPAAELQDFIATAAYYRAQDRGFEPGQEIDDWLAAEAEITGKRTASWEA